MIREELRTVFDLGHHQQFKVKVEGQTFGGNTNLHSGRSASRDSLVLGNVPIRMAIATPGSAAQNAPTLDAIRDRLYIAAMRVAKNLPPLILASASPRRAELLRQMGVEFKVLPSHAAELHTEDLTARELAQINAYRKARFVAKQHPDALVIGADTLVFLGTRLFGKPTTIADASRMLQNLQGQTHQVVTAICLLCLRHHRQKVFAETTSVTFLPLNAAAIRLYLSKVDPLDKAGAYAIQEHGELLVEEIAGSYTNVVGLPTERLRDEFAMWASNLFPAVQLPVEGASD